MSKETLLDDAITKAKEAEDWQLVEWLRMARGGESAARWYTEKLRELEDENARLRSCLSDDAENARMIMAENAKLRKLAVGMYGMLEMVDKMLGNHDACETPRPLIFGEDKSFKDVMREQGVVE